MTVANRPKARRPRIDPLGPGPARRPRQTGADGFEDLRADFVRETAAERCAVSLLPDWRRLVHRWLGMPHEHGGAPNRKSAVIPDCWVAFTRDGAGVLIDVDVLLGGSPAARITVAGRKTASVPRILRALPGFVPHVASRLGWRWLQDEAHVRERQRLIHDLHDGPLQIATAAKIRLQSARHAATDPAAAAALDDAIALTGQVVASMRALLRGRAGAVASRTLESRLRQAASRWADLTGMQVRFHFADGAERLDGVRADALDIVERVVGESMVNAWKHGRATQLSVRCREEEGGILLTLTDDGTGLRATREGERHEGANLGLRLLRSRVRRAGGRFAIRPAGRRGTIVETWLPAAESAAKEPPEQERASR